MRNIYLSFDSFKVFSDFFFFFYRRVIWDKIENFPQILSTVDVAFPEDNHKINEITIHIYRRLKLDRKDKSRY